ncbi:hypothetical protein Shyhy01_52790 [Streptomyces hygroscopicus subsp. hygroscopicus]|nr:hypothetical protein Shyhy01_52790 [Streptomyces hygroscopicus subsp. hygroscopicus]
MLATLLITMGKAAQEPAMVQRNATIACISVTEMMISARTAAVRTGSGSGCRRAGSSTHNGLWSRRAPYRSAVPFTVSLTPHRRGTLAPMPEAPTPQ